MTKNVFAVYPQYKPDDMVLFKNVETAKRYALQKTMDEFILDKELFRNWHSVGICNNDYDTNKEFAKMFDDRLKLSITHSINRNALYSSSVMDGLDTRELSDIQIDFLKRYITRYASLILSTFKIKD